uniref:Uncharacterized protein n=1 Tax=Heliothis virescens TaxID=7102 RepID=A0A2A4J447_HELVI
MNSRINVNDSDKLSAAGGKVDKKFNSTADGDTNMKGNSKDTPKTGILDDRMALGGASCVGGVRAGNKCIKGV